MQWMALAQNEIYFGLQWARGVRVYGRRPHSLADYQRDGRTALEMMEGRLSKHDWLALDHTTIADIACYPYVKRAPQGDVPLAPYPAVQAWLARCEALPGWIELR
jgi:glutathione S-transferase